MNTAVSHSFIVALFLDFHLTTAALVPFALEGPPVALFKELAPAAGKDMLGRFKMKQAEKKKKAAAAAAAAAAVAAAAENGEDAAAAAAAGDAAAAASDEARTEAEAAEARKTAEDEYEKALATHMEFSDEVTAALNEMFRRLDADLDHVLNKDELNSFMQMTEVGARLVRLVGRSVDRLVGWLVGWFGGWFIPSFIRSVCP